MYLGYLILVLSGGAYLEACFLIGFEFLSFSRPAQLCSLDKKVVSPCALDA